MYCFLSTELFVLHVLCRLRRCARGEKLYRCCEKPNMASRCVEQSTLLLIKRGHASPTSSMRTFMLLSLLGMAHAFLAHTRVPRGPVACARSPSVTIEMMAKPTDAKGNEIKPAMSSYMHFCQERRPMVTQQLKAKLGAEFKQVAVMSQLGTEWKALPDATKAKYTSMAKSDKTRYDAAFASNPDNASIKRGGGTTRARKSTGPKKLSAYLHFCAEKRSAKTEQLKASMGNAFKYSAVLSALGADWKVLDEASKIRFKQMAEQPVM